MHTKQLTGAQMCSELVKRLVLKSGLLKTRVDQKRCNKLSAGRAMAIATIERNLGIMQIIGCTLLCQSKSRGTLMISVYLSTCESPAIQWKTNFYNWIGYESLGLNEAMGLI